MNSISNNIEIPFSYNCSFCHEEHYFKNLIKNAEFVYKTKGTAGGFIPDISLYDKAHRLIIVIEIIVTHAPSDEALKFYKNEKIPVIQFNIPINSDLSFVSSATLKPDIVTICKNPRCECGNFKLKSNIRLIKIECFDCKKPLIRVTSKRQCNAKIIPSHDLHNVEREFAMSHGAVFRYITDRGTGEMGYANVCPHCNRATAFFPRPKSKFVGEHYHDYTIYYCEECESKTYKQAFPKYTHLFKTEMEPFIINEILEF